jgi:hypothetical protein
MSKKNGFLQRFRLKKAKDEEKIVPRHKARKDKKK